MSFFEVEFPRGIGYHRLGSPSGFSTTVNEALSGQESRNKNWATSRGKWTVSLMTPGADQYPGSVEATRRQGYIEQLLAFHMAVSGKGDSFRLFDHIDNSLAGQAIGVGDGTATVFQLIKTYTIGGRSYIRNITKPIWSTISDYQGNALAASVTIALNGTPLTQAGNWSIDPTTGLITFVTAPGDGTVITTPAGNFHYPVRFDSDDLAFEVMESSIAVSGAVVAVHSLNLKEVLPPNY